MLDLRIKGRRAIACASSRGLGRACATSLARAGVAVVINGIDEQRLAATADELRSETGAEITAVAADVTTPDGQAKLLVQTSTKWTKIGAAVKGTDNGCWH